MEHSIQTRNSARIQLKLWRCIACLIFALGLSAAHGAMITYDLVDLGSNQYRYEYTVSNDGSLPSGTAIKLIDIAFDPALYDEGSLNIVSAPGLAMDWDQIILASNLGDPAYFDIYALGNGLGSGQFLSGFAIEFSWLGGPGGPNSQDYYVLDPNDFSELASGTTDLAQTGFSIPAPAPALLLTTLLALSNHRSHRRTPR